MKDPVIIDNDSQKIITNRLRKPVVENEHISVFTAFEKSSKQIFALSSNAIEHLTNALCIQLGAINFGIVDKAPKGKKVYRASVEHSSLDQAIKQLAKQLKLQVKFRKTTKVYFTSIQLDHKFNYKIKINLYLEP